MNKRMISCTLAILMLLMSMAVPVLAAEEAQKVEVPVEVTFEGTPASADTVTIQLTAQTEGAPLPEGGSDGVYQETINGSGSITLVLEFTEVGVYSYTIKQLPGSDSQATYDKTEYKLTVFVTKNEDGTIGTTTVLENDKEEKLATASFHNVYPAAVEEILPARLDPPVKKLVVSANGVIPAASPFVFAMVPADKSYPMPDNREATRDPATGGLYMTQYGPGEYEFGWMYFDENDVGNTYTYRIYEVSGSDGRYRYDAMLYTMTVVVSLEGNQVVLDVTYQDQTGKNVDEAVFTNFFQNTVVPPPTPPTPPDRPTPPTPSIPTPRTGDNTNLGIWIGLLVISAVGILVAVLLWKRRKQTEQG